MSTTVESIQKFFVENNLTLAVAESLTGGTIQALLTSISGSSAYFSGGVTAYNIRQKVDILGVNEEHAASCNCVSHRVAEEMAKGIATLMGSDYGIATTGYVTPTIHIPSANAYISIYCKSNDSFLTFHQENTSYYSRISSQHYFANKALKALLDVINQLNQSDEILQD